jgi:hypothetical protein
VMLSAATTPPNRLISPVTVSRAVIPVQPK